MRTLGLAALISLAGCRAAVALPDAGADAPPPAIDAAEPDAAVCGPPPIDPLHPYGTSVGRTVRPFTLPSCNHPGGSFSLYDDPSFCEARVTLLLVAAVWCVPSQMEADRMEEEITDVYGPRGLRVVEVLMDGPTRGGGATSADCEGWVSRFGLSSPVLVDSGGAALASSFPSSVFPSFLLLDAAGVIVYRADASVVADLGLRAELDARLPP